MKEGCITAGRTKDLSRCPEDLRFTGKEQINFETVQQGEKKAPTPWLYVHKIDTLVRLQGLEPWTP